MSDDFFPKRHRFGVHKGVAWDLDMEHDALVLSTQDGQSYTIPIAKAITTGLSRDEAADAAQWLVLHGTDRRVALMIANILMSAGLGGEIARHRRAVLGDFR